MYNIVHITNTLSGKSETFIRNFILLLSKHDLVNLTCFELSKSDYSIDNTVETISFPIFSLHRNKLSNIFRKINFLDFIFKNNIFSRYDIISIDFISTAISILRDISSLNKPIFIFVHGYDLSKSLRNLKYVNQLKFLVKNSNIRFVVPCLFFQNKLIVEFGVPKNRIFVLRYGVDTSKSLLENSTQIKHESNLNLIFVGRFVPKKQPLALIEMMNVIVNERNIENVRLTLVGYGDLQESIIELVYKYNLSKHIEIKGYLTHNQVFLELQKCDLYVHHSVTDFNGDQEGLPNTILEALSLGLPVISTFHSGIPEVIINEYNGFVVQEYDYVGFVNSILRFLYDDNLLLIMKKNILESNQRLLSTNKQRVNDFINIIENECLIS